MKDPRQRFFFWLGVFVLPLFWSWFTLAKSFTRRERITAFLWLAVFVAWLIHQRSALAGQLQTVSETYPAVLGWLGVALFVWFFFRIRFFPNLIEMIVLVDVLAVFHPTTLFVDRIGQPFDWGWVIFPFVIALAHFAVEPMRAGRPRRTAEPKLQQP